MKVRLLLLLLTPRCLERASSILKTQFRISECSIRCVLLSGGKVVPQPQVVQQLQRVLGCQLPKIVKPNKVAEE